MRKVLPARAVALATAGLVGLVLAGAVAPAKAYDINVILPLTGGGAFLGEAEQKSLQVAETAVNNAGGVHGQNVHFVVHDDQSNPQTSVQLANQVIAAKPAVLLGSTLVASCSAMAALMQDGPVMYCFSPGVHPAAGSYAFTAFISTLDGVSAQIRYFRLKGWTRIAIMTSADATGQDAERVFDEVLARPENKDVTVVDRAHFNITDVSVAAQIEHIRDAKPQALIAWSAGSPVATLFKGIVQAGLDIPIAASGANMTYAQMKAYAAFLPKELYMNSTEWVPHQGIIELDPAVEAAQKQFFDAFEAVKIKPDEGAILAWDPAMIVVDALRHLEPNPSATQVRDYIARLKGFAGVNGLYDFPKIPQTGLDIDEVIDTLWSPAHQAWELVSAPTGTPLGK